MKPLDKDELYQNLQGFLKTKGIELKQGSYSHNIQKSCNLLAEAINKSQRGLARAKVEIDKKLDQVRQVIHEKTAPPASSGGSAPKPAPQTLSAPPETEASKSGPRKSGKSRKTRS